jgi:hypothetical protein
MHARTHEHVIPIPFPRQQLFQEGASVLRCTYIACIVDKHDKKDVRGNTTLNNKLLKFVFSSLDDENGYD